jgi:hypothetical protein
MSFLKSKHSGWLSDGTRTPFTGGGSGGGGPTQTTVQNTNIPEYARPYVESMLGTAQQQIFTRGPGRAATPDITTQIGTDDSGQPIFQTTPGTAASPGEITGFRPYIPYGATVDAAGNVTNTAQEQASAAVAGFSPLQQQAFRNVGSLSMPGQFNLGTGFQAMGGAGALQAAEGAQPLMGEALGYGATGATYGGIGAQQALQRAQQTGRQAGIYGGMGAGFGAQAAGLAPQAQMFGQEAADIGMGGLGYGALGAGYGGRGALAAEQGFGAGEAFARQATDPRSIQAYMSPYMQEAVDRQKFEATRDFEKQLQTQKAQAVGAGAFGGSRQAIAQAEAQRNLNQQLQNIQATGTQKAFEDAQRQQQFGAQLGLQGLGAGYQGLQTGMQGAGVGLSGLGTALQGQQARMQGLGQAGQFFGQGIQGAQAGLQGVSAQQAAGQLGLAGTAQGMQGAQTGLQGVQGAVGAGQYGLQGLGAATQAGSALGQMGGQQLAAQQNIIGMQSQYGAQQQAHEQQKINQAIQNYAMQQQYAMQQLAAMSGLLRGLPLQSATTQSYQAPPSAVSQLSGLGLSGAAAYGLANKKGGIIKSYAKGGSVDGTEDFASGGITRNVMLNPEKYSTQMIDRSTKNGLIDDIVGLAALQQKNQEIKERQAQMAMAQGTPPTVKDQILAEAQQLQGIDNAQSNLPTEYAGGGIVAFNGEEGSKVEEPKGYFERMKERFGRARESATTVPDMPTFMGIPLFGSAGPEVSRTVPIAEQGAPAAPTAAATAKPDTGIRILPDEPRAKPSIMNAPAPVSDTGMGAGGIDDLIRQSIGDIKAGGERDKDARKEAKLMAMLQAGLGIASGTSPYALSNVKGALPALQGYQEEMRGLRSDESKRIAQIAALNLKGAELKNELKKLGISEELYKAQAKYYTARANAPVGGAAGLGSIPPGVSDKVMTRFQGYEANPTQAPFFSSLPKEVRTGLTDYGPKTESYRRSMETFRQYNDRAMQQYLNSLRGLSARTPISADQD